MSKFSVVFEMSLISQ